MPSTKGAHLRAWLMSTALGLSCAGLAHGQTAPKTAAEKPPMVEEIIVTGSALPTTLDAAAVPVSTVNQAKILETGVGSNALEILRKSLPAFQGRGNTGNSNANNTNQNTAGGSQARLRDLDTLVLINGRRVAVSAVAGIGGKVFVDVNQIPPSMIDRVEVLEDGASAIYGSDAVGGVVNFILKKKFDGVDVGARYGVGAGGYAERSAYFTGGASLGSRVDVVLSGSVSRSDPLYQHQRSFTSPFYVSGAGVPGAVGTAILNPGLKSPHDNTPTGLAATAPSIAALEPGTYTGSSAAGIGGAYDLSRFQTLLLGQKQAALSGNVTIRLSDAGNVDAYGDFEYEHGEGFTQFLPRVMAVAVPAGAPYNPTTANLTGVQFGDTSFPKQYYDNTDKFRATAGVKGDFGLFDRIWRWDVAFTHSQDRLGQLQSNVIYGPNVPLAIAGGFDANGNPLPGGAYSKVYSNYSTNGALVLVPALDPFARTGRNAASLANIFGVEHISGASKLDSADAKVTVDLFNLPAGAIGLALGGAWRQESLSASADLNGRNTGATAQRWIGGQFFDPFSKSRTISSGFGEMRIPVTSQSWNVPGLYALDLIGALRFEHYSDAGNSTVPKIGFRWQPIDTQVTVRGTFSKSFTAPSLYAEYGPTDTRQAGGAIISGAFAGQPSSPFNAEDGNNPNLQPAKADTISLGVVLKPNFIPNLKFTVQYTDIDQKGIAGGIGFNNILVDVNNLGSKSIFYNNVAKNNFPGLPGAVGFANPQDLLNYLKAAPGVNSNNLYVVDQFRNLGGIKLKTFDFTLEYDLPTTHYGLFSLDSTATYLESYKYQALPSQPFYEFAGAASNSPQAGGTQPKWRLYSTVDWAQGPWTVTLANSFVDSVIDEGAGGFTFLNTKVPGIPVKAYTTFDTRVAYRFGALMPHLKEANLAVGVNNIGDATPPRAANAFTDNRADVSTYSPIGRFVYVQVSAHF